MSRSTHRSGAAEAGRDCATVQPRHAQDSGSGYRYTGSVLRRIISTASLLVCLSPLTAFAQEDVQAASAAFAEAQRAQLRGDFPRAAELFEIADQAAPSPAALRSAIRNREAAGQDVRAATLSLRAISRYGDDRETRKFAEQTVERLAPHLMRVRVTCDQPCSLSVDGGTVGAGSALVTEFFVGDGPHMLEARWPGRESAQRSLDAVLGQSSTIDLVAGPRKEAAPTPPPSTTPPPGTLAPEAQPSTPGAPPPREFGPTDTASRGLSPAFFWAGTGLTLVAGGLLTWSGLDTLRARDDYEKNPTRDDYDHGVSLQRRTNILAGATAALGVITIGIGALATDWGGHASAAVGPNSFALTYGGSLP